MGCRGLMLLRISQRPVFKDHMRPTAMTHMMDPGGEKVNHFHGGKGRKCLIMIVKNIFLHSLMRRWAPQKEPYDYCYCYPRKIKSHFPRSLNPFLSNSCLLIIWVSWNFGTTIIYIFHSGAAAAKSGLRPSLKSLFKVRYNNKKVPRLINLKVIMDCSFIALLRAKLRKIPEWIFKDVTKGLLMF